MTPEPLESPSEPALVRRGGYIQLNARALVALEDAMMENRKAIRVFLLLLAIANKRNVAFASIKDLMAELKLSRQAVNRAIRVLTTRRFITRETRFGNNGFVLNSSIVWRTARKLLWTSEYDDPSVLSLNPEPPQKMTQREAVNQSIEEDLRRKRNPSDLSLNQAGATDP